MSLLATQIFKGLYPVHAWHANCAVKSRSTNDEPMGAGTGGTQEPGSPWSVAITGHNRPGLAMQFTTEVIFTIIHIIITSNLTLMLCKT